jgi:hypothetical protein
MPKWSAATLLHHSICSLSSSSRTPLGEELLQPQPLLHRGLLAQAQGALHAVADLAPEARVARRFLLLAVAQPGHQPHAAQRIDPDDERKARQRPDGSAHQRHARGENTHDRTEQAAGKQSQQRQPEAREEEVHRSRSSGRSAARSPQAWSAPRPCVRR